ncbi:MAG: NACHT domain-containing protein, partial [bacterium]|nr:NACHT domain-containing protein [bacterium]
MPAPFSLGPHRLLPGATREERIARSREMLFRALNLGTTVAFVGSGCSAPLGYPSWNGIAGGLIRETLGVLKKSPSESKNSPAVATLEPFERRLADGEELRAVELMFIMGVCQSVAKELKTRDPSAKNFVGDYFRQAFKPRPEPAAAPANPYHALLELPIKRFVTTNYDEEIERALEHARGISSAEFGIDAPSGGRAPTASPKSFTQMKESYEQLVLFALGKIAEMENTVFHCHGRYDKPESIVSSEQDYQKWYLLDREGAPAFRQTIELLLTSNPILFVGYGLGDEDLLQPLRLLAALDAKQRETSSLFALMEEKPDRSSQAFDELLRVRYGVQVIPYDRPSSSSADARGRTLVDALRKLRRESSEWRESWLAKPFIRKVRVAARPPTPYQHYSLGHAGEILGRASVDHQLERIESAIDKGARVIAVVGRGGTGKSWHAMRLIERLKRRPGKFAGFFFWSSYYADDALTGLDRLLEYLDSGRRTSGDRLDRIGQCLSNGRYLIVLDGIERLLRETDRPEVGGPGTAQVKVLLKLIASECSKSCVILTTRLLPELYADKPDRVEIVNLKRMQTRDVCEVAPFNLFTELEVGDLCSLLDGHTYALVLAAGYLSGRPPGEAGEAMRGLQHRLARTPPDRRVTRMLREVVEALEDCEGALAREFLRQLAAFMSPVTDPAARHCYKAAVEAWRQDRCPSDRPPELEGLITSLVSRQLLFRVDDEEAERAHVLHPTVRSLMFEPGDGAATDPLPNFTLAGFTSGTAILHPGSPESGERIKKLFDRLVKASEEALAARRHQDAIALCRCAFSVVRSRVE